MQISRDVGLPITKAFEGCLKPIKGKPGFFTTYHCPAGVLTIGYGHTNLAGTPPKIKEGDIWNQRQCDDALAIDMRNCDERVDRAVAPIKLTQNQHDALSDFDFNTGGITRSSIPAKIKAGKFSEVGAVLERWNKANGQVLNGLVRRRKADRLLFDGFPEQALKVAGAHRADADKSGELMPQQTETPKPPASEVTKRAGKEIATASTGGVIAGASEGTQPAPQPGVSGGVNLNDLGIAFGIAVFAVGIILLYKKYKDIAFNWA